MTESACGRIGRRTLHESTRFCWSLLFLLCMIDSGCGQRERWATLSGSVSFNGEPVQQGTILFYPEKGQVAGAAIENGKYAISSAPGAALGTNRVEITWMKKTGKQIPAESPAPPGSLIDETVQAIPPKFNSRSELTVTLTPGHNQCDFTLRE